MLAAAPVYPSAASGETDGWWTTGGHSIKFRENGLLLALEAGNLIQEELFKLINWLTVNKTPLQISCFNSVSYLKEMLFVFFFLCCRQNHIVLDAVFF